jgi:hypothetical protein
MKHGDSKAAQEKERPMSTYVHLTDAVRKLPGFEESNYPNNGGKRYKLNGSDLWSGEGGSLHMSFGDDVPEVPAVVKDIVEMVTLSDYLYMLSSRELGIYLHGTAQAELRIENTGGKPPANARYIYYLSAKAKNLADLRTIVHKIKTGAIRPTESYECGQTGLSNKQLEDQCASLVHQRDDSQAKLNAEERKVNAIRRYVNNLGDKWWLFISEKRVRRELIKILNTDLKS